MEHATLIQLIESCLSTTRLRTPFTGWALVWRVYGVAANDGADTIEVEGKLIPGAVTVEGHLALKAGLQTSTSFQRGQLQALVDQRGEVGLRAAMANLVHKALLALLVTAANEGLEYDGALRWSSQAQAESAKRAREQRVQAPPPRPRLVGPDGSPLS